MQIAGQLKRMHGKADENGQVSYTLQFEGEEVLLNELIGKTISLHLNGTIHCIACNRAIKKSYQQGFCFPCTQTLAQCDICIVKPELCHFRHGTCREPAWGEQHCFQAHYIYLANASSLKVGITRGTNIPTRWIDQGAAYAIPILKVKDRYVSGLVEVIFKTAVADKTNWRKMLQGQPEQLDMLSSRDSLINTLKPKLAQLSEQLGEGAINFINDMKVYEFHYPVLRYPITIKTAEFDEQGKFKAQLLGIKGQYFIFDRGVMNIRNLVGQHLSLQSHDEEFA